MWFITALLLLQGCASGPEADRHSAQRNLEKGKCPSSIIFPGERSHSGRERYGAETTDTQLANFSQREQANCKEEIASGDIRALNVLLEYAYLKNDLQIAAAAYKSYLDNGRDEEELAEAGAKLYAMYSTGQPGLPRDQGAALRYLGLAAKYDPRSYELRYVDALYAGGRYAEAFAYYQRYIEQGSSESTLGKQELCEVNFKLADSYFRGRGITENWYIGYYYWLQGGALAIEPQWGSCYDNSGYDPDRYTMESERKLTIEHRLAYLGNGEINRIRQAWRTPGKGLSHIASLDFRKPRLYTPQESVEPASGYAAARVASASRYEVWPAWAPLGAGICNWNPAGVSMHWSEVFKMRSGAIWTLKSASGEINSEGSAVAVSPSTLVTNCHVIEDASDVTLLRVGRSMSGTVIAADRDGDRCIVRASEPLHGYVTSARQSSALLVGEDVAAIGNPSGLDTSLSRGLIAQKRVKDGHAYLQTDAAISSGSSGGGLFDTAGNLVGITTFKVSTGESLNFAIAIDAFCR